MGPAMRMIDVRFGLIWVPPPHPSFATMIASSQLPFFCCLSDHVPRNHVLGESASTCSIFKVTLFFNLQRMHCWWKSVMQQEGPVIEIFIINFSQVQTVIYRNFAPVYQ